MHTTSKRRILVAGIILLLGGLFATGCDAQQIAAWIQFNNFTAQRDGTHGYRKFDNCAQAVNYIFAGRWDHGRARLVTWRESRDVPTAQRPGSQYIGCAQLGAAIRGTFLKGSAYDPYYNVLALRDAVDHPRWGWCHWDIVNYCARGGQW